MNEMRWLSRMVNK